MHTLRRLHIYQHAQAGLFPSDMENSITVGVIVYNYTGKRQSMNAIPGRKAEGEVVVFVSVCVWGGGGAA